MTTGVANTGVWLIGARGGVATTAIVGALAIRQGLSGRHGMVTEIEPFSQLDLPGFDQLVIGGHDIRTQSLTESAEEIYRENGTIRHEVLSALAPQLEAVDQNIQPGVLYQSGSAIESLDGVDRSLITDDPSDAVARLVADLDNFKKRHNLEHVVVVNLASTEPAPPVHKNQESAAGIEALLKERGTPHLIASSLYCIAAARAECAYINFTPSPGAFLPGIMGMFDDAGVPYMGCDGKTGETLVKSALAPMFKYRNLRVLSWQGYNMLGDRDGEVLADEKNKETKVKSKDNLLHEFLGYPVHSKVAIDYVPSLGDFKTAFDFIHFEGFLDHKMSMQFTWHGCDSILAAPLVLDLVRMTALAKKRGESGALTHLAIFFKSPLHEQSHDLHGQYHRLLEYTAKAR